MNAFFKTLLARIFIPVSVIIVVGGIFTAMVIVLASVFFVQKSIGSQSLQFSQGIASQFDVEKYREVLDVLWESPQDRKTQRQVLNLDSYKDLRHHLSMLLKDYKLRNIYTVVADASKNYYYVIDSHESEDFTDVSFHIPGEISVILSKNKWIRQAIETHTNQQSSFLQDKQENDFSMSVVPLTGRDKMSLGVLVVEHDVENIATQITQTRNVQIALLIGFVFLAVVTSFLIIFKMTHQVRKLNNSIQDVKAGNLTGGVIIGEGEDELSDFSRTLDTVIVQLADVVRSIKLAGENSSEFADKIEHASGVTRNTSENIALTLTKMAVVTDEMEDVSLNAVSVVGNLNQSFTNVTEIIQELQTATEDVSEQTEMGARQLKNSIMQIESVEESLEFTSAAIRELDGKSKDIVKVISMIDDLADQTNLLALNASIEAARAGEHGKGFAIVADEVNELAEQSSNSTLRISTVVQEIQAKARQAASSMSSVLEEILLGTKAMKTASDTFEKIIKFSYTLSGKISDIHVNVDNMSSSVNNVSKNMRGVAGEAKKNSARLKGMESDAIKQIDNMEIIAEMAEKLQNFMSILLELVYHFKITPGQDIDFSLDYNAAKEKTTDLESLQSAEGVENENIADFFSQQDLKEIQEEALAEAEKENRIAMLKEQKFE